MRVEKDGGIDPPARPRDGVTPNEGRYMVPAVVGIGGQPDTTLNSRKFIMHRQLDP